MPELGLRRVAASERVLSLPPRDPSARQMVRLLRDRGVAVSPAEAGELARSPARVAALQQKDFGGATSAFDHIARLADTETLRDGTPSTEMARDLFLLAGTTRVPTVGRCYARTSHAVFSMHHTGEFARLVSDLAVRGDVKLMDGSVLRWDPRRTPVAQGQYVDTLWAGIAHTARLRVLPENGIIDVPAEVASHGEMANLYSRLTGKPHVNVQGSEALPFLQKIVSRRGPMLAEFGAHAGSVARVTKGQVMTQEAGNLKPTPAPRGLGYVVVPLEEAKARDLHVLQYPGDETGYVGEALPRGLERMQEPAASNLQFWFNGSGPFHRITSAAEFVGDISGVGDHLLQQGSQEHRISDWVRQGLGRPELADRIRMMEDGTVGRRVDWATVRREMIEAIRDDYRDPDDDRR